MTTNAKMLDNMTASGSYMLDNMTASGSYHLAYLPEGETIAPLTHCRDCKHIYRADSAIPDGHGGYYVGPNFDFCMKGHWPESWHGSNNDDFFCADGERDDNE